jgi:hypothetical protein
MSVVEQPALSKVTRSTPLKAERERQREIAERLIAIGRRRMVRRAHVAGHHADALIIEAVAAELRGFIQRGK